MGFIKETVSKGVKIITTAFSPKKEIPKDVAAKTIKQYEEKSGRAVTGPATSSGSYYGGGGAGNDSGSTSGGGRGSGGGFSGGSSVITPGAAAPVSITTPTPFQKQTIGSTISQIIGYGGKQGTSWVDKTTGKAYETSLTGVTKEITPYKMGGIGSGGGGGSGGGFSGTVEEFSSLDGEPSKKQYFVEGEEVGVLKTEQGKQVYEPSGSVATGNTTAKITIGSGATRQEIYVSPSELREIQFQQVQQSAGELLFGGEEVEGNIQLPSDVYNPYETGTRQDIGLIQLPPEAVLRPPGTIYKFETGTNIQGNPIYRAYTIDELYGSRQATIEEIKLLSQYQTRKEIEEFNNLSTIEQQMLMPVPFLSDIDKAVGVWGRSGGTAQQVIGGFVEGFIPSTVGELATDVVIYGVSAGVGFAAKAVGYGLSALPGVAGKLAPIGWKGLTTTAGVVVSGIYAGQTIVDLETAGSINEQSKIIGNVAREFGVGYFGSQDGSKGADYLFKSNIMQETLIKGRIERVPVLEKRQQIITEKVIKEYSIFKQMYVKTPSSVYSQSRASKFVGLEPKLNVLSKGQTYIYQPFANTLGKPIEVGKAYIGLFGRVGSSGDLVNKKYFAVQDFGNQISPRDVKNLYPIEKYVWKGLIESRTGVPAGNVDLGTYFSEKDLLYRGATAKLDILKLGSGESLSVTTTGSRVVTLKEFSSGAGVFKFTTGSKEIIVDLPRASGRVTITRGTILKYPPYSVEGETGIDVFIGGGKKSSAEFLQNLYKDIPSVVNIPNIKITKPVSNIVSSTSETSGINKVVSSFTGTGLYERTEDIGGIDFSSFSITGNVVADIKTITPQRALDYQNTYSEILSTQKVYSASRTNQRQLYSQGSVSSLSLIQSPVEMQKMISSVTQVQQSRQTQRQIHKMISKSELSFLFGGRISPPFTTNIVTKFPKKEPPILVPEIRGRIYPRQSFGRFPVYVRRFGQYKIRGYGKTPEEAVGIGKEIVSKTLGATFKVPSFKGIKVSGYRTKKEKGGYVFIEPSKRRLSTSSELREIFSYKRAKSRGKKR